MHSAAPAWVSPQRPQGEVADVSQVEQGVQCGVWPVSAAAKSQNCARLVQGSSIEQPVTW